MGAVLAADKWVTQGEFWEREPWVSGPRRGVGVPSPARQCTETGVGVTFAVWRKGLLGHPAGGHGRPWVDHGPLTGGFLRCSQLGGPPGRRQDP